MPSFPEQIFAARQTHRNESDTALALFKAIAPRSMRVPGMDTVLRLAWRIAQGRTAEQSAAREYVYRWHLAIDNLLIHVDGTHAPLADHYAPHALGM
jgi:hypothetical protein